MYAADISPETEALIEAAFLVGMIDGQNPAEKPCRVSGLHQIAVGEVLRWRPAGGDALLLLGNRFSQIEALVFVAVASYFAK